MPTRPTEYLNPDVIQQVARLDLKAKFIVEGFISGLHRSPYQGFSVEFSEHRKYNLGDEIKSIDWGVYAKTDKYYVRKYEAETNLECTLAVDMSESMGYCYGKTKVTKLEYATYLSAALGYLMIHQQDPVGLITFDEGIRNYHAARSKRSQLISILSELSRNQPGKGTDFRKSMAHAAELLKHRGLVVLFSDLLCDPQEVAEALHQLRFRGHEVILFHVLDPSEKEFPFEGATIFEDIETGRRVQVDPERVRREYRERMEEFIEDCRRTCQQAEIDYVQVTTSTPFDKALMEFLLRRERKL